MLITKTIKPTIETTVDIDSTELFIDCEDSAEPVPQSKYGNADRNINGCTLTIEMVVKRACLTQRGVASLKTKIFRLVFTTDCQNEEDFLVRGQRVKVVLSRSNPYDETEQLKSFVLDYDEIILKQIRDYADESINRWLNAYYLDVA